MSLDSKVEALKLDRLLPGHRPAARENAVDPVANRGHPDRRSLHVDELRRLHDVPGPGGGPVDRDLVLLSVYDDEVLHALPGTSSHTVSTCAVCGNMSKPSTDSTR